MQNALALRFTPLGSDETLEAVQRKYVSGMVDKMRVRNLKGAALGLERPAYQVFVAGSLCVSDADDSHQGPGLCFSICVQCAAIVTKEPQWVDSVLVDTIMRLGALSYESLQRSQRSDLSRPGPLFQQHEHLRKGLFILSARKVMCPKTAKALAEEKRRRAAQLVEMSSSSEDEDSDEEGVAIQVVDRFEQQYVDDHIVTYAVVDNQIKHMERVMAAHNRAGFNEDDGSGDEAAGASFGGSGGATSSASAGGGGGGPSPGGSPARKGSSKFSADDAASSPGDSSRRSSKRRMSMSALGSALSVGNDDDGSDDDEKDGIIDGHDPVCVGVICTEHAQRTGGYTNCHHHCMAIIMVNGGARWLVFDPMKRARIDKEPGATPETNAASFSMFEKKRDVARFVSRRLANMDVTEFTFTVLSRNSSGQAYDAFLRAGEQKEFNEAGFLEGVDTEEKVGVGGQDLSTAVSDEPENSRDDHHEEMGSGDLERGDDNNERKKRAFVERARRKDLLLAENLLVSRRKSVFRDALTAGVSNDLGEGGGADQADSDNSSVFQAVLHWRTLYICLIRSMWHLPAFRYHFVRGRPAPTAGPPVKCIVKAMSVLMGNFDKRLTAVLGDNVMLGNGIQFRRSGARTSRSRAVTQLERAIYGTAKRGSGDGMDYDDKNTAAAAAADDDDHDDDEEEEEEEEEEEKEDLGEDDEAWRKYQASITGKTKTNAVKARAKAAQTAILDLRSPFQKRRERAAKRLSTYLGSTELNTDLTNLHQNLDNISLSQLDPGHIITNLLQATHSATTGTIVREDPRSRCSCYEPPHSGTVAQSAAAKGTGAASLEAGAAAAESTSVEFARAAGLLLPGQTGVRVSDVPGRRMCLGHSVFHIDVEESRTCLTCGATDYASQAAHPEVPHYMSFVHRVNMSQLRRVHGILSVGSYASGNPNEIKVGSVSKSFSATNNKDTDKIRFDDVLRGIIDRHWLRPCPRSPLCELCLGRLATTGCVSCDPDKLKDEFPEQSRKVKQQVWGKNDQLGRVGGSDLIDQYQRDLAHRFAVSLCFQCDRHIHRASTKLGINSFQGSNMSTVDAAGNPVRCSSCYTDGHGGGGTPMSDANGDADMQRMYQTTGPVKTIETFSQTSSQSKKTLHQSQQVEKQLYLCERCFEMNLFPPLTNRSMFCEKLENRKFVTLLQQQLNEDFRNEEAELEQKFKVLRSKKRDERARIEVSWRMPEGVEDTRQESQKEEAKKRAKMKASLVNSQLRQIKADYKLQKRRLVARKTLEVNRKMSAMLRSRRDAMTLTASHVKHPLMRARRLASSEVPCPINSASKTTLRSAPSVFTVALDWPESEPSGSEIELVCSLVTQNIELDRVFHIVKPRPESMEATWSSLLLLLIRCDTADRICEIMNEMIAFAMTKPVPRDFPMKVAGVVYVKSNGGIGKRNLNVENIIQGDKLAAIQQRHKAGQSRRAASPPASSGSLGSGRLNPSASTAPAEASALFGEKQNSVSVLRDRQVKNEDRSTWNFRQCQIYERLVEILLRAVESGNASHSLSNLRYRPCSMVCRKINAWQESGASKKVAAKQSVSESDANEDEKKAEKIKARHGRHGESQSARSKMFRHLDSEIAELQQHTSYFFHEEQGQWCQMDRQGGMHFISTGVLLQTMVQKSEYPVLMFYDRIPAASSKYGGSGGAGSLGGAVDASSYTKRSYEQRADAASSEAFGEMRFDAGSFSAADFASGSTWLPTSAPADGGRAAARYRNKSSSFQHGGGNHDRENCAGGCATM